MKICIFGAGAIGGYVGALLARAGTEVTLIARGPHLAAIRANGLRLITGDDDFTVRCPATDDPAEAGVHDYVILTLKAHQVPPIATSLAPLLGPDTAVVPAVNGVPWWYFHKLEGPWQGQRVASVDPGDAQWTHIGPERVIGCVVYPACEIVEPGVVRHTALDRMPLGEPDGTRSDRAKALSQAMIAAGMKAPVRPRIRDDVWVKLWGNCAFNPVSVLTGGTLKEIGTDAGVRDVVRAMMVEARAVAEKLGVRFAVDVDARVQGAVDVGDHKSSTLQDFEAGKPLEIDAMTAAVCELGRLTGTPTPTLDLIYALVRQRAITAGCYPRA